MFYRGCWHIVSRGFLLIYRPGKVSYYLPFSWMRTEFYNPKAFFTHAALLRQACAHCGRFPTAASRRSLGRVSVPMWPFTLSGRLLIIALVGRYPTNWLIRRESIQQRQHEGRLSYRYHEALVRYAVLAMISHCYSPLLGRSLTRYSPIRH